MKKYWLGLVTVLFTLNAFSQQTSYSVLSTNEQQTIVDVHVGALKQIRVKENEVKIIVQNGSQLLQKGNPDLPKLDFSLIIPNQKNSTITILESEFKDYANIEIVPSKGSISRSLKPETIPFIYNDTYHQDAFFPNTLATLNIPYVFRDFRGQTVHINPVQYNPITKVMRVYSHLKVKLDYSGVSTINTLTTSEAPTRIAEEFDGIYQNHFLNYKKARYSPILEQGSLLVLCPAIYLAQITPLVQWKEQKGIRTFFVNTDTITGGVTPATIKNIATNYYNTNHIAYLLLVGDNGFIPPYNESGVDANYGGPSDSYYSFITNNDHYPEFSVGRLSGESAEEISIQVNKTLAYEKTPNTNSNWMRTQLGIGSNDPTTGDDNQHDFQQIHDIVDSNKNQYNYLTNIEMYDGANAQLGTDVAGDPDATMVSNAINGGLSLINYCGHGYSGGIITSQFTSGDVQNLTNINGQWPFFFVVGCNTGTFMGQTCFAEALAHVGTSLAPSGTIGNFMSTIQQSWDEPMQAQDEFNAILRGARANDIKSKLGVMCVDACASMNDQYDTFTNPRGGSDMTDTWVYFGDPTVAIYTKNEGTLSITHASHLAQNATSLDVYCAVDGTTIGLFYQDQYWASATVTGGVAHFNFAPLTVLDSMNVTATKQNYSPAFGIVHVVNWPNGIEPIESKIGFSVYPNPAQDEVFIESKQQETILGIRLFDTNGQTVQSLKANNSKVSIDTKNLAKGIYTIEVQTITLKSSTKFTKN